MSQKLDTFKGKITAKSTPQEISKTLSSLQEYLEKYEEKDASKVIEQLKTNTGSHQDKLLSKQFIKLYSKRTEVLKDIAKSVKRMQEDLIDEQDTSIKKRGIIGKAKSKVVGGLRKTKNAISTVADKAKSGLDFIGDIFSKLSDLKSLIPMIIGGIASFITGIAGAIASFVLLKVLKVAKWIFKLPFKIAKFVIKNVAKLGKFVVKIAFKAVKFIGGMVVKLGVKLAKFTAKGLAKLREWLSNAWGKIKSKISSKASKVTNTVKNAASKVSNTVKNQVQKLAKPKGDEKSWLKKGKEAIEGIKKKVIPSLEKAGSKGVAKAVGKALGKIASKAFPIIGWGLLAYDAYNASKKSDSLTSFGVNLLDEASGGLISLALGDTKGKDAGHYIEDLISGDEKPRGDQAGPVNGSNIASSGTSSSGSSVNASNLTSDMNRILNYKDSTSSNNVTNVNNLKNSSSEYSSFYNNYNNNKNFSYYNEKVLNGDMTVQEAIEALSSPVQPLVNSTTNIENSKYEELKMVKDAAVAESTQIAAQMSKAVLNGSSNMISTVQQSNTEYNMNFGDMNPNNKFLNNGNQAPGSYQG